MIMKKVLSNKEEYATFIAKYFKLFNLNLDLCDPANLQLNEDQLFQLMEEVQKRIPESLSGQPYIDISIQSCVEDIASIYLYSPYSSNAIIGFCTQLKSNEINLESVFERLEVRKDSLSVDIEKDEFQSYNLGTIVILIVDDDKVIRAMLIRWLKQINESVKIIEKHNGKEAVEYITSGSQCDLIFMDIQMPLIKGDLASTLIRNYENVNHKLKVPIIAMTASGLIKEHLERSGINLAFKKPFHIQTIFAALRCIKSIALFIPASEMVENPQNNDRVFMISIPTDQEDLFVIDRSKKKPAPTQFMHFNFNTDEDTFDFQSQLEMASKTEQNELSIEVKESEELEVIEEAVEEEEGSGCTFTL